MENKYQRSKNNLQCLGACYPAGKWILHPLTQMMITNQNEPFCTVNPHLAKSEQTNNNQLMTIDTCYKETDPGLVESDTLNPTILFDPKVFINVYYNITTYDAGLAWLEKNIHLPLMTKLRVVNCLLAVYQQEFIDSSIIDLYIELFKTDFEIIYNSLYEYIHIENNEIVIEKRDTKQQTDKIIKTNFIYDKLINSQEINKFISSVVANNVVIGNKLVVKSFTKYCIRKLEKIIKK